MAEVPATSPAWRLENHSVTVHIPMRLQRRGGRKLIVAPKGSEAWAPAVPTPDNILIRALGRAHRWRRLLENGTYATVSELAKAEKVNDPTSAASCGSPCWRPASSRRPSMGGSRKGCSSET